MTRKRRVCQITLSDDARDRLDKMAELAGTSRSGMVEKLVRETEMPRVKANKQLCKDPPCVVR